MPNTLTGDFEAAVEIRIEALNRILATLHQAGAFKEASPKLLHGMTAQVGDSPKLPKFELAETFLQQIFPSKSGDVSSYAPDVLSKVQKNLSTVQKTLIEVLRDLSDAIGPSESAAGPAFALANFPELFIVRGIVQAQLSILSITFPEDTTSEVTVHCQIRALYIRDPGTAALPAPIHGDVKVGFEAKYQATGNDGPMLEVKVTDDDNKIGFVPAPGTSLTAVEAKQISREIRRFLRTKFKPMTVDLEEDFPFRQFKCLGTGSAQAIALPFNPSGAHIPAFADFPTFFLTGADDFAVAFRAHYIKSLLQPVLDALEDFSKTYKVKDPAFGTTLFIVHVWVSGAALNFETGAIILTVTGGAHLDSKIPFVSDEDYDLAIQQKLSLTLDVPTQTFSLQAVGNLSLAGSLPAKYKNEARKHLEKMRDDALDDAQGMIRNALKSVKFDDALKPFDAAAKSKYTSVEIQPGGVVLRGTFTASQRPSVVVDFAETTDGKALTAFKSWIPAGTVEKYVWSWVSQDPSKPILPWSGTEHEVSIKHRFLFKPQSSGPPPGPEKPEPKPPLPWKVYQMCLLVEGTQVRATPGIANVSGGEICQVEQPDWLAVVPSWWDALLMVPVWGPDPGPEGILENAIVGHVNVRVEAQPAADAKTSSIIHFTDLQSEAPLSVVGEALLRGKHKDSSLPVVVVLPRGSFQQARSVVERKLGSLPGELQVPLAVTEDYEDSWSRAFNPTGGSATYLLSGDGELVWESQGQLDAASLTCVLNEHAIAGRRRRSHVVRLAVQPGEPALDLHFEYGQGHGPSLSRLRGRRVLLLFWKSCLRPCLAELRRLQHVHNQYGRNGTVVVAIADGEDAHRTGEIGREHNLGFTLIPDPDRRNARQYGVNCWPTIVSINENGLVDFVHSGITHHREVAPDYSRPGAK